MRILHTADWHIGQTLAGFERDYEHRAVLAQLAVIAAEREVDALLVAGDVFDHQNPSGEAQRLFYEALVALKRARPAMTIVVTAGNHDAAGRLEAPRALLDGLGVRVVGSVRRVGGRIDAGRHLIALSDASGRPAAEVLALSYPTAACLPISWGVSSDVASAVRTLYAELHEAAGASKRGLPLIVTGHLHVAGGLESEGAERRILVGGQHAVPPDVFPAAAAYVALGHLHRAQSIGRRTIRYSGSLLPLSATELGYDHGVSLVTVSGADVVVEHIVVDRPVPFLRVPERGEVRLADLGDVLKGLDLPADVALERRPFLQVHLARDGWTPGLRAEAERIAEQFPARVVDVRVAASAGPGAGPSPVSPPQRLVDLTPETLFRQAFERKYGTAPSDGHLAAFHAAEVAAAAEH